MFPLAIVAILVIAIWIIAPEYSAMKVMQTKLDEANKKLADVESKKSNAASLLESLNSNAAYQKTITEYLPEKKQDEYVVASINSLAAASGVAISGIGFAEDDAMQSVAVLYDDLGKEIPADKNVLRKIKSSIGISGKYDQIRKFLFSLTTIKRLNGFDTLTIAKGTTETPDILTAKAEMTFSYLNKIETVDKVNESFFASGQFDADIVNDIHKKASIDMPRIDVGAIGRSNIFAL